MWRRPPNPFKFSLVTSIIADLCLSSLPLVNRVTLSLSIKDDKFRMKTLFKVASSPLKIANMVGVTKSPDVVRINACIILFAKIQA